MAGKLYQQQEAQDANFSAVEDHWDNQNHTDAEMPIGSAWWNTPMVIRHINNVVCGYPLDGIHAGFHEKIGGFLSYLPSRRKALTVGCGVGTKEMDVIERGFVDLFECYEVSSAAIETGRTIAKERGIEEKIIFHHADAFTSDVADDFDLVYWNNALHHMMDTREAIRWSKDRLKRGGIFAIDDYVGATRNQHSQELIDWGSQLLMTLPERLRRHWNGREIVPSSCWRVDPVEMAKIDPSECADSESILPAIDEFFPGCEIIKTGGAAYFVALTHTFHNYRSETDLALLSVILNMDQYVSTHGNIESQYAVVIAQKQ